MSINIVGDDLRKALAFPRFSFRTGNRDVGTTSAAGFAGIDVISGEFYWVLSKYQEGAHIEVIKTYPKVTGGGTQTLGPYKAKVSAEQANHYIHYLGAEDSPGFRNGIAIYRTSAGNERGVSCKNGASTTDDFAIDGTTVYSYKLTYAPAAVEFFIDGASVGSVAANIPDVDMWEYAEIDDTVAGDVKVQLWCFGGMETV